MNTAYIALGSNIGDRKSYLEKAIEMLKEKNIQIEAQSSIYETPPVGYLNQGAFFNMVIRINTAYTSDELLEITQQVEQMLGRVRTITNGPRTIDLDILMYNDENKATEKLQIPHPRMGERFFVLCPLSDVYPAFNRHFGSTDLWENRDENSDFQEIKKID